ncbi:hypothetical protein BDY21DRAFT_205691 [Lineolata rhizophorae]|uniref:DNA recombination and repair protein Rad51-like C-terminal domain-containing protein n=1 Tax=Lineolata rhizophorae TaxID=578093 RepID=A0A6A6P3F0_9PEZI|nr:hypothetical protein BDY21DRAFT_205691 [Lineolata rhizophorae]
MSAEELGGRLKEEVVVEGLDELLASFRATTLPPDTSPTGLDLLDDILTQSASRISLGLPPLLELTSNEPGAGKTHLLYLIAGIACLPPRWNQVPLHGKGGAVAVIDADDRFNVDRLARIMKSYVLYRIAESRASPPGAEGASLPEHEATRSNPAPCLPDDNPNLHAQAETLIISSLHHIHLFRPQSHTSLLATLARLPAYFLDPTAHPSSARALHALLLDGAGAFLWPARADAARAAAAADPGPAPNPHTPPGAALLTHLRAAAHALRPSLLVCTTSAPLAPFAHYGALVPGEAASASGSTAVVAPLPLVRVCLARAAVPRFPAGISVQEAEAQRRMRQEVVERGRFVGWVVGGGGGREMEERRGRGDGWGFEFVVDGEGVRVGNVEQGGGGEG